MPHISPKHTSNGVLQEIYNILFITSTSRLNSRKQQEEFFNELFTNTEKIMLGKRLAAITLLSQGESPYKVGKILQLSETTTNKFHYQMGKGVYKNIVKLCGKHKKGKVERYLRNLVKPLPKYGTSPASLFKE